MSRSQLTLTSVAMLAASAVTLWAVSLLGSAPHEQVSEPAQQPATVAEPEQPAAARHTDEVRRVRREIARQVEHEVVGLQEIREVESYLQTLEERARSQGSVSALEVEPGITAIQQLVPSIGPRDTHERLVEFTQRMARLSEELDGTGRAERADPRDVLERVRTAADEESKQAGIRAYLEATSTLPPESQREAIAALNELVDSTER